MYFTFALDIADRQWCNTTDRLSTATVSFQPADGQLNSRNMQLGLFLNINIHFVRRTYSRVTVKMCL
jgi:hypothetical protein